MSASIRIIEPLGERAAALPLDLGGEGAALVLPGVSGAALSLHASGRQWLARPAAGAEVRVNGIALQSEQVLADGDVIAAGDAQLIVLPDAARIEVRHLAGNDTIAPLQQQVLPGDAVDAGVREVFAAAPQVAPGAGRGASRTLRWASIGAAAAVVAALVAILFLLVPVPLQLEPEGASVESPGLIDWQAGERMFLLPGQRTLTISHPGYRSRTLRLDVQRALADATPLPVALEYLPGILEVDTAGVAAQLLIDGQPAGEVPGEVSIPAGTHDLILRAPRHIDHVMELTIDGGGARQQLAVTLQPSIGTLVFDTDPAGAAIRVDGEALGKAPQRLELEAGLHQLELVAPGRRAWKSEVAIIAGRTLDLGRIDLAVPPQIVMRAAQEQEEAADSAGGDAGSEAPQAPRVAGPPPPPRISSPLLGSLVLLPAGQYLQGSARREQGRRSNEVQRTVTLTRAFYLAATEVSNAQFRAFRAEHSAGIAKEKSLDLDAQAVSNVSWNDAVEFCNWLSLREGLPAAYERRAGRWQLVQPFNTGYRLPTEAEWEYAARYVDGRRWQPYAWGETLPPPQGAANLAGAETLPAKPAASAPQAPGLPDYGDEHEVIAPVGSYAASPAGLFDLGGNLSEWMHDVYASLPASGDVTDPMGPDEEGPHAIRGANWTTTSIADLRLAWRDRAQAPSQTLGFRVARFAEESP